jgi:hypothetical protein
MSAVAVPANVSHLALFAVLEPVSHHSFRGESSYEAVCQVYIRHIPKILHGVL